MKKEVNKIKNQKKIDTKYFKMIKWHILVKY